MKRIRNLTLAIFSALALTAAVGAVAASASQFAAESYPTTLKSSSAGSAALKFHSVNAPCTPPALEGTLASASYTSSPTAKDTTCEFFGTPALKMNGCKFTYRPGAETAAGVFKGKFDIGPAGCGPIQFGTAGGACYITIPSQNGLAATYENVGAGTSRSVKVTPSASGITHTQVSGGFCGGTGTFSDGSWTGGAWTIGGTVGGKQAGVFVESTGPTLAILGTPPQLTAESYPMSITGQATANHYIQFAYGKLGCKPANFTSSFAGPTEKFSIEAAYSGCTIAGLSAVTNMNGCTYYFSVLNKAPSGSTYYGHADIQCPPGKAIEIVAGPASKPRCTITMPEQTTDAEGLTFTNELLSTTIAVGIAIKGIDYHQQAGEGAGSCSTANGTTGTYTGSSSLSPVL